MSARTGVAASSSAAWKPSCGACCSAVDTRVRHCVQRGVKRGDRVAVVMPQRPETAVCHIALHRLGAVVMPLSMLFGPEALAYRLQDSGAVAALVDETSIGNINAVRAECPALALVV